MSTVLIVCLTGSLGLGQLLIRRPWPWGNRASFSVTMLIGLALMLVGLREYGMGQIDPPVIDDNLAVVAAEHASTIAAVTFLWVAIWLWGSNWTAIGEAQLSHARRLPLSVIQQRGGHLLLACGCTAIGTSQDFVHLGLGWELVRRAAEIVRSPIDRRSQAALWLGTAAYWLGCSAIAVAFRSVEFDIVRGMIAELSSTLQRVTERGSAPMFLGACGALAVLTAIWGEWLIAVVRTRQPCDANSESYGAGVLLSEMGAAGFAVSLIVARAFPGYPVMVMTWSTAALLATVVLSLRRFDQGTRWSSNLAGIAGWLSASNLLAAMLLLAAPLGSESNLTTRADCDACWSAAFGHSLIVGLTAIATLAMILPQRNSAHFVDSLRGAASGSLRWCFVAAITLGSLAALPGTWGFATQVQLWLTIWDLRSVSAGYATSGLAVIGLWVAIWVLGFASMLRVIVTIVRVVAWEPSFGAKPNIISGPAAWCAMIGATALFALGIWPTGLSLALQWLSDWIAEISG